MEKITPTVTPHFYYAEIPNNPITVGPITIIENIRAIMVEDFKKDSGKFTVLNIINYDSPTINKQDKMITITADPLRWCQISYQFCHEFCHLLIGDGVAQDLRWFEESICELSSIYFMGRLSRVWKEKSILGSPGYAESIQKYAADVSMKNESIPLHDLFIDDSQIYTYLKSNEYDRPKNNYIAKILMPIFLESPSLWEIVPLISKIPDKLSFSESLLHWKEMSPEVHHHSLDAIFQLFKE